ncbi:MAG: hypothetical protein C4617_04500 [Candidatus Liberibacter europaeus]|uniref:Uncharacterized protein n=1 Tax=Candidatus Liberibacter europaeus TaxID=744859 RepID=A0A2T4VWY1_9HYPH|nr:hypothetical protein [Candidatus Liberibacter europaeus]PTL86270.1 MAG: hypothetical protein C4617_04500 [Candidatus Liberibacter europaeus]
MNKEEQIDIFEEHYMSRYVPSSKVLRSLEKILDDIVTGGRKSEIYFDQILYEDITEILEEDMLKSYNDFLFLNGLKASDLPDFYELIEFTKEEADYIIDRIIENRLKIEVKFA